VQAAHGDLVLGEAGVDARTDEFGSKGEFFFQRVAGFRIAGPLSGFGDTFAAGNGFGFLCRLLAAISVAGGSTVRVAVQRVGSTHGMSYFTAPPVMPAMKRSRKRL
jgi:hypothetical protein